MTEEELAAFKSYPKSKLIDFISATSLRHRATSRRDTNWIVALVHSLVVSP